MFEIDHPNTLEIKLERLKNIIKNKPNNITYVPVDFNIETLSKRLLKVAIMRNLKHFLFGRELQSI